MREPFVYLACGGRGVLYCPLKKRLIHLLCQDTSLFIVCVGVGVCDHPGLCVSRVTLNSLNIAVAELELYRGTAMP